MGKKIFVSYKYKDSKVYPIQGISDTTARHYVDSLSRLLDSEDHIYKGEDDGESMESLSDATIGSKLGDKIFDSTVTIVLISKGMKEAKADKDQWMPWEISYSLKEQSRQDKNSKTNAILAVVLPDENNLYNFYIEDNTCPHCNCRRLKTDYLFDILRENMFNVKKPVYTECENHIGSRAYQGYSSYIYSVKWIDFINDIGKYIDVAIAIRADINSYNLKKSIS